MLFIFIYVCNVCFPSGFKRGADPGMPEPTIWRYVMVPNVHTNPVQMLVWVLPLASSSWDLCFRPLLLLVMVLVSLEIQMPSQQSSSSWEDLSFNPA